MFRRFLSASLVLHVSTLRGRRTPKAGGDSALFETRYVELQRRTTEGGWEVLRRVWNDSR